MSETGIVVVGGGLAGARTLEALRDQGYEGRLTLVGAEPHLPYERPALSKDHLLKGTPLEEFTTFDAPWYDDHDVALRLGVAAVALDLAGHTVTLSDGETLGYTRLALATGSRARQPDLDGAGAEGVHLLRTIEDSERLDRAFHGGARIAVVGGGWIGLEAAAAARARGAEVTVLEMGEQPLGRILGTRIGGAFAELHRRNGVDVRTGVTVARVIASGGRAAGVELEDGSRIDADAVLFGIGAAPNIELAAEAGLAVKSGVLVDAGLRTSDPDVVAVGDIAEQAHPALGRYVRVEHWDTARHQPEVAARTLRGEEASYDRQPLFFTDQYDLGMEYRGNATRPDDVVVRGSLDGAYLAFWLDEQDRVEAAMNVNSWDAGDALAAMVAERRMVDRRRLADPDVPLPT